MPPAERAAPDLSELTARLLDAARAAGADAADALAVAGDSLSIEVRAGRLEHAERSEGIDIGIRVLIGQRQASVAASDIRPETIAAMAERAVAMAREAPEDPYCGLADPAELARVRDADGLDLVDPAAPPAPEVLQAAALEAEAAALAVEGVAQIEGAGAGWSVSRFHLAASNGFSGGYGRSSHSLHASAISGEGLGMEREHAFETRVYHADLPGPEEVGRLAGERAASRAGATRPPTGAFPVLFDERVARSLIGHLAGAANGLAVARGASWLKDAMDEPVLPEGLDLAEDPLRPRIGGSRPFDGEGLAAARRKVVEAGRLRGWFLDLATARQLGLRSTGNAARGTGGPPSPGAGNLMLTQGAMTREELMAEMGTGLLVTGLIGSTINPTSGDYSRGASGFWVEGGRITRPVGECTIAGNLRPMLRSIRPANDGPMHLGTVVPSLLVEGLVIAGA